MKRYVGFLILLIGIFLAVLGLESDRSIAVGITEALQSGPHYRAVLLLLGGVLSSILGFIMVFSQPRVRRPQ